jgi:opacity protein-like surface antigen
MFMGMLSVQSKNLLLATAALLPVAALADVNYYLGLGGGGTRIEGDLVVTTTGFDLSTTPSTVAYTFSSDGYEATEVGYRVFAGVRIGQYLALEGGYVDFGSLDDEFPYEDAGAPPNCNPATPPSGNCNRIPVQSSIRQDVDLNGFELYALGRYPFAESWAAYAKIGVLMWDLEFSASDTYAELLQPTPGQQNIPKICTTLSASGPPQGTPDPTTCDKGPRNFDDDGTDLAWGLGVDFKAAEHMTLRAEGTWFDIEDTDKAWLIGFDVIYNF